MEHLPLNQQQLGRPARMPPHHPPLPVARIAPSLAWNARLIHQGEAPVSPNLLGLNFFIYSNQLPPSFFGPHNISAEGVTGVECLISQNMEP